MFCTGCGAALPADAKFCPKCGAAVSPAAAPSAAAPPPGPAGSPPAAAPPMATPPTAAPPKAAPSAGAPGALDLTQPKVQAEIACLAAGAILALLGVIGVIQGGSYFLVLFFSLFEIGLGGYAIWGYQLSRQGKLALAQQAAGVTALSVVVLGVVGLAMTRGYGGGPFVISLLIAGALGFAYWRIQQLRGTAA